MAHKITGHIEGLNTRQLKTLERLERRRLRADAVVTQEFAVHLTQLAKEFNRKIAVLVDRRGHITNVMVGTNNTVYLPDIGRQRAGKRRLRGLRLIIATLQKSPVNLLTQDELIDLSKLRLDMIVAAQTLPSGLPGAITYAHLQPKNKKSDVSWSIQNLHHINDLKLDFDVFILELESELGRKSERMEEIKGEPTVLVHLNTGERDSDSRLEEMLELCKTAGLGVFDVIQQRRRRVDPKFVVGKGKLEELELRCLELGAELLVFSRDLTPTQSRSIANRTDLRILDRTQVILDIFAQRAQTRGGKLQVELAQLRYNLPKLIQKNTAMSRLTGGIGGRGPGETKLEINRRRARDRIRRLERDLENLSKQRSLRRQRRRDRAVPVISLVGYTNAGKSTLLNTLTNSVVCSEDKLFATLDPTSRRLRFPEEREVILTDTVGFIRDLPKALLEAFKATLEELDEADVLLHIVEISNDDHKLHINAVVRILEELKLHKKPRLLVLNKADLLDPEEAERRAIDAGGLLISALDSKSTQHLLDTIDRLLWREGRLVDLPNIMQPTPQTETSALDDTLEKEETLSTDSQEETEETEEAEESLERSGEPEEVTPKPSEELILNASEAENLSEIETVP